MQTNRKYLHRVYTSANKPQWIKPIRFNEAVSLKALLSGVYDKVNEIIEALPNNWPVLIDVDMQYTAKQIKVVGSVFLDFNKVELNETLSIENDGYTGLLYVNLLNDRFRPVLEISPKFMEANWTTLYVLNVVDGNIQTVVYNDIYAGMHESDPNAHPQLVEMIKNYITQSVKMYLDELTKKFVVFDGNGVFQSVSKDDFANVMPSDIQLYRFLVVELADYEGHTSRFTIDKKYKGNGSATVEGRTVVVTITDDDYLSRRHAFIAHANGIVGQIIELPWSMIVYRGEIKDVALNNPSTVVRNISTTDAVTSQLAPYLVPTSVYFTGYNY